MGNERKMQQSSHQGLEALPVEVIVHQVFQCLELKDVCSCRLVSTTWNYYATSNLRFRHKLDFSYTPIISETGLHAILQAARQLRVVLLDECWTSTTEENLLLLAKNCPKLCALSVRQCKFVTDYAIKMLSEWCKDLQELDVSSCFKVSDKGLSSLISCKSLQTLLVSSCYGVTDRSIKKITKHCLKLMELDVGSCPRVTDVGLEPLLEKPCGQLLRIKSCNNVSTGMVFKLVKAGIFVNNMV